MCQPHPAACTTYRALDALQPARLFLQAVAVCVSKTAVGAAYVATVAEALPALPADLAPAEEDSDFVLASGAAPAGAQEQKAATGEGCCFSQSELLRWLLVVPDHWNLMMIWRVSLLYCSSWAAGFSRRPQGC